ncbi:MAG: DUF2029 domain-containing protein [Acidimicrobiia bacterium]|nr:DUF2029 domain-containing protein [Acidimicrobiia bacterium]NNF88383.1 DUF2029 domain-containing protein [Acidimicrobiia bacterium]NNL96938.1 DUF2029 domain-containing protein [Acidimicrobiia bacterium]RZV47692.1 MAG: DUF2029 domain-containing protein [Acidimicrobiia bacterium]
MTLRRWPIILFLLVATLATIRLVTTLAEPGSDDGGYADFRDTIHAPVVAMLDGVNPYDVSAYRDSDPDIGQAFPVYSPHHLLLTLPFGVLPRTAAGGLWWALNVVLLVTVSGFVMSRVKPEWGLAGTAGLAAAALLSNPGRFNFLTGQATLPLVLGTYVAFTSPNRWLAGAGTALALIKPQVGIPVLILLAAAGRWRVALDGAWMAAAASAPIVLALSIMEGSPGQLISAVRDNLDTSLSGDEATSSFRIDLLGVIGRETDRQFGTLVTALVFLALIALGIWLLRRWGRVDAVALAVVSLTTLLGLFHLPYDELLLIWPIAALILAGGGLGLGGWRWWAAGWMLAAAFNPLTVRFLRIGRGLDTITSLFLILALVGLTVGIVSRTGRTTPAASA